MENICKVVEEWAYAGEEGKPTYREFTEHIERCVSCRKFIDGVMQNIMANLKGKSDGQKVSS